MQDSRLSWVVLIVGLLLVGISGRYASVSGGVVENIASGESASVSGGHNRSAPGNHDWVAGGLFQDN